MKCRIRKTVFSIGEQHDDDSFAKTYLKACDNDFAACSTCGRAWRIRPNSFFELVWKTSVRGTKIGQLGDFTWHRSDDCTLMSDRLKQVLAPYLDAVSVREVVYENNFEVQNQNSGRPLWEITELPIATVDIEATTARLIKVCPECGDKTYNFNGEMPLTVNRSSWHEWDLFTLREFQLFFVSRRVLNAIEGAQATNYRIRREAVIGDC